MTSLKRLEQTKRNPMMNVFDLPLSASLAYSAAALGNSLSRCFPSDSVSARGAALPAWVSFTTLKLGLPFGHAGRITECQNRMKVSGGAGNVLATPITPLRQAIGPAGVWFSDLPFGGALRGAVDPSPSTHDCLAAGSAWVWAIVAPSAFQVAGTGTEPCALAPVLGVKGTSARFTIARYVQSSHSYIIPPIEIEERYCAIAVDRLRQSVLDFGTPEPQYQQAALLDGAEGAA